MAPISWPCVCKVSMGRHTGVLSASSHDRERCMHEISALCEEQRTGSGGELEEEKTHRLLAYNERHSPLV